MRSLQLFAVLAGPSLGAWLIAQKSRAFPFVVAAGLSIALLLLAFIALSPAKKAPGETA